MVKQLVTVTLLLVLLLAGCTQRRPLQRLRYLPAGTHVDVDVRGETVDGWVYIVNRETIVQTEGKTLRLADVDQVTRVRRGSGAAVGFVVGLLVGAGVGAIVGASVHDEDCGSCLFQPSQEDVAVAGALLFGLLGSGVGLLVGYVRGSRVIYEPKRAVRVGPGPSGSVVGGTIRF